MPPGLVIWGTLSPAIRGSALYLQRVQLRIAYAGATAIVIDVKRAGRVLKPLGCDLTDRRSRIERSKTVPTQGGQPNRTVNGEDVVVVR